MGCPRKLSGKGEKLVNLRKFDFMLFLNACSVGKAWFLVKPDVQNRQYRGVTSRIALRALWGGLTTRRVTGRGSSA
jgi:hypothetical protein